MRRWWLREGADKRSEEKTEEFDLPGKMAHRFRLLGVGRFLPPYNGGTGVFLRASAWKV
jgi:hypothetical protein